jgi:hypothetical protein
VLPTDKLFTGQQREPVASVLGLYNYGARFYSTLTGRFVSPDPFVPDASDVGGAMQHQRLVTTTVVLLVVFPLLVEACAEGSSAGDADWSSFTAIERPGLIKSDLDDLSRKAGFRFVLPSYVPPGVSHEILLSSQIELSSRGSGSVNLIPDQTASRDIQIGIQIDESLRPSFIPRTTSYGHDFDVHRIGAIDVGCLTVEADETWPTPVPNEGYPAGLTCEWDTEELVFRVGFGWPTESGATPEVTPQRLEEVLKVITSMIEDPYVVP